jgi:hypothetical protein
MIPDFEAKTIWIFFPHSQKYTTAELSLSAYAATIMISCLYNPS